MARRTISHANHRYDDTTPYNPGAYFAVNPFEPSLAFSLRNVFHGSRSEVLNALEDDRPPTYQTTNNRARMARTHIYNGTYTNDLSHPTRHRRPETPIQEPVPRPAWRTVPLRARTNSVHPSVADGPPSREPDLENGVNIIPERSRASHSLSSLPHRSASRFSAPHSSAPHSQIIQSQSPALQPPRTDVPHVFDSKPSLLSTALGREASMLSLASEQPSSEPDRDLESYDDVQTTPPAGVYSQRQESAHSPSTATGDSIHSVSLLPVSSSWSVIPSTVSFVWPLYDAPPSPCKDEEESSTDRFPSAHVLVIAFLVDALPRLMYLHLLLRLPSLYFSRVTRIFEEAEMGMPMIRQGILDAARANAGTKGLANEKRWNLVLEQPIENAAYINLQNTWQAFIDSLLREWKTLNVISVLLLSAILTVLQIESAASDPLTRFCALLSMICALMSLLYGCIYIIRFGTMRKTYKGAAWAQEAQKTTTNIWWNIWVMLAMPATWLAWSMILFIVSIMAFVWRTSPFQIDSPQSPILTFSLPQILIPRILISVVLSLGIIYFILMAFTLRRYGDMMDRAWQKRIQGWLQGGDRYGESRSATSLRNLYGNDYEENRRAPEAPSVERPPKLYRHPGPKQSAYSQNFQHVSPMENVNTGGWGISEPYTLAQALSTPERADSGQHQFAEHAKTGTTIPENGLEAALPYNPAPDAPRYTYFDFRTADSSLGENKGSAHEPKMEGASASLNTSTTTCLDLSQITGCQTVSSSSNNIVSILPFNNLLLNDESKASKAYEVALDSRLTDKEPNILGVFPERKLGNGLAVVKLFDLPLQGLSLDVIPSRDDLKKCGLSLDTLENDNGENTGWERFLKDVRESYWSDTAPFSSSLSLPFVLETWNHKLKLKGVTGLLTVGESIPVSQAGSSLAIFYFHGHKTRTSEPESTLNGESSVH